MSTLMLNDPSIRTCSLPPSPLKIKRLKSRFNIHLIGFIIWVLPLYYSIGLTYGHSVVGIYQDSSLSTSQKCKFSRFIMEIKEAGQNWLRIFLFQGHKMDPCLYLTISLLQSASKPNPHKQYGSKVLELCETTKFCTTVYLGLYKISLSWAHVNRPLLDTFVIRQLIPC